MWGRVRVTKTWEHLHYPSVNVNMSLLAIPIRFLPVMSILVCFQWERDGGLTANERLGMEALYFLCI